MRKQIPNLITCMNVISGTLAIFLAMYGLLTAAAILILVGMVFDFFRRDDRPSVACQVGDRERTRFAGRYGQFRGCSCYSGVFSDR